MNVGILSERGKAAGADDVQLHAHDKPGCEISKTPMTRREKRRQVPLRPFHNPRSSVARHNNLGSQRKASLQEESAVKTVKTRNLMLNAIKTNLYCLHCLPPQPTYVFFRRLIYHWVSISHRD